MPRWLPELSVGQNAIFQQLCHKGPGHVQELSGLKSDLALEVGVEGFSHIGVVRLFWPLGVHTIKLARNGIQVEQDEPYPPGGDDRGEDQ